MTEASPTFCIDHCAGEGMGVGEMVVVMVVGRGWGGGEVVVITPLVLRLKILHTEISAIALLHFVYRFTETWILDF